MNVLCVYRWLCPLLLGLAGLAAAEPGPAARAGSGDSDATIQPAPVERNGQHDFAFEFGAWQVALSRLVEPLSGSTEWVDYRGTSVVRKVWDGRANLGELDVTGPSGSILGLSLRLYDPAARQWRISWANSRDGALGRPMSGAFSDDGRGVFYGEDSYDGRAIFVRFVFSDITDATFRFEQAFSVDGGASWEPNWIARFTRQSAPAAQP